jgi:hypothetical protein
VADKLISQHYNTTLVDDNNDSISQTNPLPVDVVSGNITIDNATIYAQLTDKDNVPNPGDVHDSIRIGDGTTEVQVTSNNELKVRDADSVTILADIENNTDQIESLITSSNTKLDTLITQTDTLETNTLNTANSAASIDTKLSITNSILADIENGIPEALGQTTSANSMPVVISSDQSSVAINDAGTSITVDAINLDIRDLNSASDSISSVQSGTWNINNITGTVSLPTGAATAANQTTEITHLASIDSDIDTTLSSRASESTLSTLNSKFNTLGQKTSANSAPVVLASDQSAIPITDNGGSITVDGTVSAVQSGNWSNRLQDGSGNNITSQTNGAQRALDVGVNVSGVQVDPRQASPGTITDRSGTATTTSAQLAAANSARKYLFIQNVDTGAIWFNFGVAAVAASPSIRLDAGDSIEYNGTFIPTDSINIRSGTGSKTYVAKEG